MHAKQFCRGIVVVLGLLAAGAAGAADVFHITATVNPGPGQQTAAQGFDNAHAVFDRLSQGGLSALLPSYTGSEVATVSVNYRGLAVLGAYPAAGQPQLRLDIPVVGIAQTFFGSTREESRQMLRDYFRNADVLGRILQALAERSPADPVAGNPASLQTRMVSDSFNRQFRLRVSQDVGRDLAPSAGADGSGRSWRLAAVGAGGGAMGEGSTGAGPPRLMVEAGLSQYESGGLRSTTVSLPFSLALGPGADPPFSIDGALQHTRTEGANSDGGYLGAAYRLRLHAGWYLTPSASVGAVFARDLGAAGALASVALSSAYRLADNRQYVLWLGNHLNLMQTINLPVYGYDFDARLRNTVLTNGLVLSLKPSAFWQRHRLEFSIADARYFGSALYDRRYDELGVAIVAVRPAGSGGPATLRAELNLLDTTHSRGWGLRLQANF